MRLGQQIASAALLAAIVAVAIFLRFDNLGRPSYWLDEILGQIVMTRSAELPFWRWLGGVHPQHGPLYYLTQLLGSAAGEGEWTGRLCAALFGVATVPLLWITARRATGDTVTATVSALLLALSPLHVYYSREARPYALLILLTTALLLAILLRAPILAGGLVVLMAYTTVGSAAALVAAAVAALVAAQLQSDPESRRAQRIIALAAAISLALLPLLYRTSATDAVEAGFSGLNAALFDTMVRGLAVTALGTKGGGYAAYAMLVFAVIGAIALLRRERAIAVVVIVMTLLPIAVNLAVLRLADHFFAVRYITPALPAYLLLVAAGIAAIAHIVGRRFVLPVAIVVAAVLATQGWTAVRTEAFQKLDWRAIAQTLRTHVRPGDVILAAEPWSEVSLRYYLGEIAGVKLIHMRGWGIAEIVAHQSPAAWLVTAGASADPSVRQWMCRYPVLLSSPLEGFRLHYAPSAQHFLRSRSGPAEQRAASAALGDRGFTLRMGADDDVVIGSGWAQPEGSAGDPFRWAIGRRATLIFPRHQRRNRAIRFHALPLHDPALSPQNVQVSLNGHAIRSVTLALQWSDYSVDAAAAFWHDGLNTLTFDFDRATAPASNDPSSADRRELAAAFRRISIDDIGFDSITIRRERPLVPSMRLATDELLLGARKTKTRFPGAQLRRDSVEALLGRLGIDPVTGWTKLVRAEVRFEDVTETIAFGSDCEDDAAFLRRAFAILLERKPNEIERRDLLQRLGNGATREHVISRITKAGNFSSDSN